MTVDDRDVPLNEFESEMLSVLLAAQNRLADQSAIPQDRVGVLAQRRPYRRPLLVGAAAAIAGVGIAAIVVTAPSGANSAASAAPAVLQPLSFTHGTQPEGADILEAAARRADARSNGPEPVRYTSTQNYNLSINVSGSQSSTAVTTSIRDVWEAPDGSALVREQNQMTDRTGADIGPAGAFDHSGTYGPGGWADVNRGFPTTASSALAALSRSGAPAGTFSVNVIVGGAAALHLATGTASPQQTAAIYGALETLPGLFYAGTVTDGQGRTGQAVGIVTSSAASLVTGTEYFVVSPTTGQILDVELVDSEAPPALRFPPGPIVESYAAILTSTRVPSIGSAPSGA
jgi:hypothetical protein